MPAPSTPYGSLARRAVLAAGAGDDLILCAGTSPAENTPSLGITARTALVSALAHHRLGLPPHSRPRSGFSRSAHALDDQDVSPAA